MRRKLGIGGSSYDFEENWLVCDFAKRRPLTDVPTFRQVCDPAQPTSIVRIGPDHHRFSFMLEPDETPESATDPGRVWQRVSRYLGPEDAELIRVANYVFRSRVADTWRRGRVLLAGDAAHEMPPFLAQGMCSGMRDAHNIAWKLDLVLTGRAEADLLDSYQPEREPHVRFITEKAIALGRVQTLRDPELARERDERLLAQRAENQTPERLRFPNLTGGLVDPGTAPQDAGAVWPQDRVARDGTAGRWDDVAGQGLQLVLAGRATLNELDQAQRDAWTALGGITIVLGQDGAQDAGVVDVDGSYAAWMAERECDAVVVRPDWYTYGTARGPKELGRLLDGLSAAMRPGRSAAAEI